MKITIITGGSRGIGRSAALQCARRGGGVIASLLSDDNAWINAQTIEIAGGYII